ncbi:hypothetical protein BHE74_00032608 [Ensete ventricosum]|nr:hypothetical protein GW17_00010643 [Ensete ventricosum]RWW60399.1 hypothetical protein BHE74_00032608 [Ensete ventricosum]
MKQEDPTFPPKESFSTSIETEPLESPIGQEASRSKLGFVPPRPGPFTSFRVSRSVLAYLGGESAIAYSEPIHEPEHEFYSPLSFFINPATKNPPTSLSLPPLADDSWQVQASFSTGAHTRGPWVWGPNDETTHPAIWSSRAKCYRSQPSDP